VADLTDIVISRVRKKILIAFFDQPQEMFYVRQMVRKTDEEINAVRRELGHLKEVGLLTNEKRGNRLYYELKKDYPYFNEILGIVAKNVGLGKAILDNKNKLGRAKFAMISGKFLRRLKRSPNDVDLLVVGNVEMKKLGQLVTEEEKRLKREINYTLMSNQEFKFRKSRRDPFILSVIYASRVMIIGDEQEMLKVKDDETKSN